MNNKKMSLSAQFDAVRSTLWQKTIFFSLFVLVALSAPQATFAQVMKPFTQRTSIYSPETPIYHIRGDYALIGNTNMEGNNTTNSSNSTPGTFVDIDEDNSTSNSSRANLTFSTEKGANPECTKVIYAGLYWSARYDNRSSVTSNTRTLRNNSPSYTVDGKTYSVSISSTGNYNNNAGQTVTYNLTLPNGTVKTITYHYAFSRSTGSWFPTRYTNVTVSVDGVNVYGQVEIQGNNATSTYTFTNGLLVGSFISGDVTYSIYVDNIYRSGNSSSQTTNANNSTLTLRITQATGADPRRIVKFKHENGTYQTLTASQDAVYYPTIPADADDDLPDSEYASGMYVGYADVTDIVKLYGQGNYYCADIPAQNNTLNSSTGVYAGWTLVVVYENSKMKWRDITLFDGFAQVRNQTGINQVEIDIDGFHAVQVGHVNLKLGVAAAEGDGGVTGDAMQYVSATTGDWATLRNPATNATNNMFAGSTYPDFGRYPHYTNNKGVDNLSFYIDNPNNTNFVNEQTSARFRFTSSGDLYVAYLLVMGIDAYIPDAQLVDAVMESDATIYDPDMGVWVTHPGDTVIFTMKAYNEDHEAIRDIAVDINLPVTVDFLHMSAEYADGRTGEHYFNPTDGTHGTATWTLDYMPAGYPDSVWATFKLHAVITKDCYTLASTSTDCELKLIVNGTISGTTVINNIEFTNDFIQGFEQEGMCRGDAISEDLVVILDREDYLALHCNCSSDPAIVNHDCFTERVLYYCVEDDIEPIPFTFVSQYYPLGTRFYNATKTLEYTNSTGFPPESWGTSLIAAAPSAGMGDCESSVIVHQTINAIEPDVAQFHVTNLSYCKGDESQSLQDLVLRVDSTYHNETGEEVRYTEFPYVVFYRVDPTTNPSAPGMKDFYPSTDVAGTQYYWAVQYAPENSCYKSEPQQITVTVNEVVHIDKSQETPSCQGTEVTFTPDAEGGSFTIPTEIQPYFTLENGVLTLISTAPAGSYQFTYTAPGSLLGLTPCGPESMIQTITHVITPHTVGGTITPATATICRGSQIPELTLSGHEGTIQKWQYRQQTGGTWGEWMTLPNNTWILNQSILEELATGTYEFRAEIQSGECAVEYSDVATISVGNTAAPEALTLETPIFVCVGSEYQLAADNSSYRWYANEVGGTPDPSLRTGIMGTSWESAYVSVVTVSGSVTCESNRTQVEARPYFSAGTISSTGEFMCDATGTLNTISSIIDAAATPGTTGGTIYYQWYMATNGSTPQLLSGANGATLNPNNYIPKTAGAFNDGTYLFTRSVAYSQGALVQCDAIESKGSYKVHIGNPDVTIAANKEPVLCSGNSVHLSSTENHSSLLFKYQWFKDDVEISGATNRIYTATSEGAYKLEVTHRESDCSGMSNTIDVTTDGMVPTVPANQTTAVDGCAITDLPAPLATVADIELQFGIDITDNVTADDNLTVSSSDNTISNTCPFVVERTYTITDGCDNAASFVETITIESTTKPVIATVTNSNPNGECNPESIVAPTFDVTDVCGTGVPTVTPSAITDGANCTKTQTFTATYTNACNVSADAVVVTYTWKEDITKPTIGEISNQEAVAAANCQYAIPDLSVITADAADDACGTVTFVSQHPAAGALYDQEASVQNVTVTVTVKDECGNTESKEVTVTIPARTLTASALAEDVLCSGASTGSVTLTVIGGTPEYSYEWNNMAITKDLSNVAAGTYDVTVTDAGGCTATATAMVTQPNEIMLDIMSTDDKTSICYGGNIDLTANATNGVGTFTYAWTGDNITTATNIATITVNPTLTTEYSVTVEDENGCAKTETFTLTVNPIADATITGDAEICNGGSTTLSIESAPEGSTYLWSNSSTEASITVSPTSTQSYSVTVTPPAGGCVTIGSKEVVVNPLPTITLTTIGDLCPNVGTEELAATIGAGTQPYTVVWSGDFFATPVSMTGVTGTTATQTATIPATPCNKDYTVMATITDSKGCTTTPSTMTVSVKLDEGITLTGGTNSSTIECATEAVEPHTKTPSVMPMVKDACGQDISANYTLTTPTTVTCEGTMAFVYTYTDCANHTKTWTYTYTLDRTTAPVVESTGFTTESNATCADLALELSAGQVPSATDACGNTLTATLKGYTDNPTTNKCEFDRTYTYEYEDCVGLKSEWSYTYHIKDDVDPEITCPKDTTINTDEGKNYATITIALPTVTDNCQGAKFQHNSIYATTGANSKNASGQYPIGTTTVTYTAIDSCNNTNECSFTVTVVDNDQPKITCPQVVKEQCVTVPPAAYTTYAEFTAAGGTATDNDAIDEDSFSLVDETEAGTDCNKTITRTYSIKDVTGNEATCDHIITLKDTIAPTIGDEELHRVLNATDCKFIIPDLTGEVKAISTDNCSSADEITAEQDVEAGSFITGGERTIVTVTVRDACGNASTKQILLTTPNALSVTLTAEDSIICYGSQTKLKADITGGKPSYEYAWTGTAITTATNIATITVNPTENTEYSVTVTDQNGCEETETINITVKPTALEMDDHNRYIRCNGDTFSVTPTGAFIPEGTKYTWTIEPNIHVTGQSEQTIPVDTPITQALHNNDMIAHNVIYHVTPITDGCAGDTFTIVVLVEPTPVLTLTCPSDVYKTLPFGQCEIRINPIEIGEPTWEHSLDWTNMTIKDNAPADSIYTEGEHTITWTMEDECGNVTTCDQKVIVTFPTCPDAIDFEGNVYHSVRIDCNCFTQRNLESTKYSDGADIPGVYNYYSEIYPDVTDNVNKFGRLYDWPSVVRDSVEDAQGHVQGICPGGWYIITEEQYEYLNTYGVDALKSPLYWLDGGGNNSSGFTSLPGGHYEQATDRYLNLMGEACYWTLSKVEGKWTSSMAHIKQYCSGIIIEEAKNGVGYSVRCVKAVVSE